MIARLTGNIICDKIRKIVYIILAVITPKTEKRCFTVTLLFTDDEFSLEDGAYDLIICNHVLEHVTDYKRALQELRRILSPGGKLIISFPVQ